MKQSNQKDLLLTISTAVKYLGTAVVILVGALSQKCSLMYLLCGLSEEIIVFALGEFVLKKNRFAGWLLSSFLILIIFAQYAVLKLGGSFTSMIMVTNLHAAGALSGNSRTYLSAATLAVIIFALPVRKITYEFSWSGKAMISGFICDAIICCMAGIGYSPVLSMGQLGIQLYQYSQMQKQIADKAENSDKSVSSKIEPVADNGYKYPVNGQMPNIVLIFTEGLSQNIVDDSRNIMPNVKEWEGKTIDFTNYYNHTAATYRGITGQLHSGYQFDDLDRNGLTSLQDVLSYAGYDTTFINPEPNVEDFTSYLKDLGFQNFVDGDGSGNAVSDKKMYEMMYQKLQNADSSKPQFLAMYTFGTHVGQNSPDEKYGDGSNPLLNKFWNLDYQFGQFMNRLQSSSAGDNTLVVFTTDHCSAKDADFDNTFSGVYERKAYFCDEIPLMFWYKGVQPVQIDVKGRNSLDMAPTLLDFLNIGQPDTFEGSSLFSHPSGDQLRKETTFGIPDETTYYSTKYAEIKELSDSREEKVIRYVTDYVTTAKSAWNQEKEKKKK